MKMVSAKLFPPFPRMKQFSRKMNALDHNSLPNLSFCRIIGEKTFNISSLKSYTEKVYPHNIRKWKHKKLFKERQVP